VVVTGQGPGLRVGVACHGGGRATIEDVTRRNVGRAGVEARRVLAAAVPDAPPVGPLDDLVRGLGVQLVRNHQPAANEAGFLLADGSHRILGVNSACSPRRERFAIAHLLGHFVLHQHRKMTVCHMVYGGPRDVAGVASPDEEQEASRFAVELLIPQGLLAEQVGVLTQVVCRSREEFIARLAGLFEVSPEAMGFRLVMLGMALA
jgi:Zn-dependent peptidase ImmA (M78 family)